MIGYCVECGRPVEEGVITCTWCDMDYRDSLADEAEPQNNQATPERGE